MSRVKHTDEDIDQCGRNEWNCKLLWNKTKERCNQNKTSIECANVYQGKKRKVEKNHEVYILRKLNPSQRAYHLLPLVTDTLILV
jgi:hypothetical protein